MLYFFAEKRFCKEAFFICGGPQAVIFASHISISAEASFPAQFASI